MAVRTPLVAIFSLFLLASCGGGSGGQPPVFSVVYIASEGGLVDGHVVQEVLRGEDAEQVMASPFSGYQFVSWSDGWPEAARHDQDIQADVIVTATFERNAFKIGGTVSGLLGAGLTLSLNGLETLELDANGSFEFEGLIDIGFPYSVTVIGQPQGVAGEYCSLAYAEGVTVQEDIFSVEIECNLLLAGDTPWQESVQGGVLVVTPQTPSTARVDWQAQPGETYSLLVGPSADLPANHESVLRHDNVSPGFELKNLSPGLPVYLALESPQGVIAWTSFIPRTWTWSSFTGEGISQAVDSAGQRYLGAVGEKTFWQPVGTGSSLVLPGYGQGRWPLAVAEASGNLWQSGDPEYVPAKHGQVRVAAADGLGGWYLAGDFSEVEGLPRDGLAHIDANGQVTDWAPQVSGRVSALAVSSQGNDRVIYVGGRFSQAGGEARGSLAAFDQLGELLPWSLHIELLSGPGEVDAIALLEDGGALVVGGKFDQVVDQNDQAWLRSNLVMVGADAAVSPWSVGTTGRVLDILIRDDVVYVGGEFFGAGPAQAFEERQLLAAFSVEGELTSWQPPASGTQVNSLAALGQGSDLRIYAGGNFEISDNANFSWDIASIDVEGNLQQWDPLSGNFDNVYAVVAAEYQGVETIYVAGRTFRSDQHGVFQEKDEIAAFGPLGEIREWLPENALGQFQAVSLAVQSGPGGVTLHVGGAAADAGWGGVDAELVMLDESGRLGGWFPDIGTAVRQLVLLEDDMTLVLLGNGMIGAVRSGEGGLFWSAFISGCPLSALDATTRDNDSLVVVGDGCGSLFAYQLGGERLMWYPDQTYPPIGKLAIDYREFDFTVYAGFGDESYSGSFPRLAAVDGSGATLDWGAPLQFDPGAENEAYVNSLSLLGSGESARIYVGGLFYTAAEGGDGGLLEHRIQLTAQGGLAPWRATLPEYQSFITVSMVVLPVSAGERAFVIGYLETEPDTLYVAVFDAADEGTLLSITPLPVSGRVASFAVTEEAVGLVYSLVGDFEVRADSGRLMRKDLAVFAADGTLLPR